MSEERKVKAPAICYYFKTSSVSLDENNPEGVESCNFAIRNVINGNRK